MRAREIVSFVRRELARELIAFMIGEILIETSIIYIFLRDLETTLGIEVAIKSGIAGWYALNRIFWRSRGIPRAANQ